MTSSPNFINHQKKLLVAEKIKLEKKISELKKYPDYGDLDDDNTQELVDFENNMSAEDSLSELLKEIDIALRSIEAGTYGQCKKCKNAIERGRLEAMPSAKLCATCESKKQN